MYKVYIVCCAYSSPLLVQRFWRSLKTEMHDKRLDAELILFNHAIWPDVSEACRLVARDNMAEVELRDYKENRGLALSWGDGIEKAYQSEAQADCVILANDDIQWRPGDLYKMVEACVNADEDVYMVTATGMQAVHGPNQSMGHSLFAYTRHAERKIGYPDANIFPAFKEDQDLWYRAKLAGMREIAVALDVFHVGSAHMRGIYVQEERAAQVRAQTAITQRLNSEYTARKWGNLEPSLWSYDRPFANVNFDYKIRWEDRLSPYPGYNRTDQEIVKL